MYIRTLSFALVASLLTVTYAAPKHHESPQQESQEHWVPRPRVVTQPSGPRNRIISQQQRGPLIGVSAHPAPPRSSHLRLRQLTSTSTVTSTVSTASTIPAPATFTPVQSSLPGSTYSGSGGPDPVNKRAVNKQPHSPSKYNPLIGGHSYPQDVSCQKWTHQQKCHTTVKTSTKTVIEKTSTDLVTTTTTTTSTSTTFTTTVYAACATNNLADTYLGTQGFDEVTSGFLGVVEATTDTAYDCCVAALLANNGDTSVWAFQTTAGAGSVNCFIGTTGSTCPAPATNPSQADSVPDGDLVIGNAYCGEINFDNVLQISSSAPVKRSLAMPTLMP